MIKSVASGFLKLNLILLSAFITMSFLSLGQGTYDVYQFGAKGDGITLDTKAIQSAIDQCHNDGGGNVLLYQGEFISGTLYLKSNVNLQIESGAILRASNNLEDFPITSSKYRSYEGTFVTNKMLIYAEDAKNISILGRGTIDGNGDHWGEGPFGFPSFSIRPRIIHFRGCENISIKDVTLYNSASWTCSLQNSTNIVITGITVDSRPNEDIEKDRFADSRDRNTDGLDIIDCQQVRISNCYIKSGDDGLCLKSFSPEGITSDITISNCVISTNASAIKVGTETAGIFQDIVINNCTIYDNRNEAVAILSADGAQIDRVTVSNISMRNIKGAALAVRLGTRNRAYHDSTQVNTPRIKDVIFENIQGTKISTDYGSNITGVIGIPVENITLRNINLKYVGGGTVEDSYRDIPEKDKSYPGGRTFGRIPAYGLFVRHARGITLDNVLFSVNVTDDRPAVLVDQVEDLEIRSLKAAISPLAPELIRLRNVVGAKISYSQAMDSSAVFLTVEGENSDDINLLNNDLRNIKKAISTKDTKSDIRINDLGNLK